MSASTNGGTAQAAYENPRKPPSSALPARVAASVPSRRLKQMTRIAVTLRRSPVWAAAGPSCCATEPLQTDPKLRPLGMPFTHPQYKTAAC